MRIDPSQTIKNQFHPSEIQEDKKKTSSEKPPVKSADADEVSLSKDIRNLRRFSTLATTEHIDNMGLTEKGKALIQQRIQSGYYNQAEIERETSRRVIDFLFR